MHEARLIFSDPPTINLYTRYGLAAAPTLKASGEVQGMTGGAGGIRGFYATLNSDTFCANVTHSVLSHVHANTDWSAYGTGGLDPWYSGIEVTRLDSGPVNELYVDNWELWQTHETHRVCPFCQCVCAGIVLPGTLTVTAHGTGCMADVDGEETTITWDRSLSNWTGTMTTSCTEWGLTLTCPPRAWPFDITQFTLAITGECFDSDPCSGPGGNNRPASDRSSCVPLWMEFGRCGSILGDCDVDPFIVYNSDLACPCCTPDIMDPSGINGTFCFEVTA
jgi:hypothetical protein